MLITLSIALAGPAWAQQTTGMSSPSANTLVLYTNSAEQFHIDSSGKVGIGTLTPLPAYALRAA